METVKDIWASLVAGVRERTTNPLTAALVISWIFWNYKFAIVLISNESPATKLQLIERLYPANLETYLGSALLMPIVTAFLYVLAYPLLSRKIVKYSREHQIELANSIKVVEGNRLLTVEEMATRSRRHEMERRKWDERETELESKIQELRNALDETEDQVKGLSSGTSLTDSKEAKQDENASLDTETLSDQAYLSELENIDENRKEKIDEERRLVRDKIQELQAIDFKILISLSEFTGPISTRTIADQVNSNLSKVMLRLEDIKRMGLTSSRSNAKQEIFWALTPFGRKLAVTLLEGNGR